jgi:DNA-binding transcriptional LysR family regulator
MSIPPLPQGLLQLLWFVRIVEAGSFAEAARRTGTTTSAMSKALARLEKTYQIRLLHRTTHTFSLTDEGERLLIEGRQLLSDLERAENVLSDLGQQGAAGRVRVSAPTAFARTWLMPRLPAFLTAHPEIAIELHFADNIADLAAEGIDIAIRSGELSGWPAHVFREILSFSWVACAAPEYLQRYGVPEKPADLTEHVLIGFRNRATGQTDSWRFCSPLNHENIQFTPQAKHIFDDAESAWDLACAGLGIVWAPEWLAQAELRSGRMVEILREWRTARSPLYALRLQRRHTPLRTAHVMAFIATLASELHK